MKKLFYLLIVVTLFSCGKDEFLKEDPPTLIEENSAFTEEEIYKNTGCRPINVKLIQLMRPFETSEAKYLYGAKGNTDEKTNFWVSKFTKSGEFIWEKIVEDKNYSTYAILPNVISNGDIVIANVKSNGSDVFGGRHSFSPVILNVKDGTVKLIEMPKGYFYDQVGVFESMFFCNISENELMLNENARKWAVQISNDGKILNQAERLNYPQKEDVVFWDGTDAYVNIKDSYIYYKNVDPEKGMSWDYFYTNLPAHDSFRNEVKFDAEKVYVDFILSVNNKETERRQFIFSKETGVANQIEFKESSVNLLPGEQFRTELIFKGFDNTNIPVTYETANSGIATVDKNGVITGKTKGTTAITVKSEDGLYSAECTVEVQDITDRVSVSKSGSTINIGGYVTTTAYIFLSNSTGKTIYVKDFSIVNGFGQTIFSENVNSSVPHSQGISYNITFSQVYMPRYIYTYTLDGKEYQAILED